MNRTARILTVALAVVLVSTGIYFAYDVGFDAGALAAGASEGDRTLVVDHGPGWRGGFGFFPFFWIFPLFFFLFLFGAFRRGPRWGGGPGWGPSTEDLDRRLEDWHRKAHEQS